MGALPDGDVLIHAGDFSMMGKGWEIESFAAWLAGQPHRHKIVVAGNHDWLFQRRPAEARELLPVDVHYLADSSAEIEGVRFWGSPWQPEFGDWAFNLPRGKVLAAKWALVPEGVDVLVTHGPPFGVLDTVVPDNEHVGCADLAVELTRIRPKVHVFGHIHSGAGMEVRDGTTYVNASICNERYQVANRATVVEVTP